MFFRVICKCTSKSKHLEEASIQDFKDVLQVGQKAVEYTALAKGVYEAGQTLFSKGRAVAPMAAALL